MLIKINNFKSILSTEIFLKNGLNVLIGPNGSGKTCIFSGIKFIRDILELGTAQAIAKSGGPKLVYRRNKKIIEFLVTFDYGKRLYKNKKIPCQFEWKFQVSQRGPNKIAIILSENFTITGNHDNKKVSIFSLSVDRKTYPKCRLSVAICSEEIFGKDLFRYWEYYYPTSKKRIRERFKKDLIKLKNEAKEFPDASLLINLSQYDNKIDSFWNDLTSLNEYNIIPELARKPFDQLPVAYMKSDGGGVSSIIEALKKKDFFKIQRPGGLSSEDLPSLYSNRYYSNRFYRQNIHYKRNRHKSDLYENALEKINQELTAAIRLLNSVDFRIDPTNGKRYVVFDSDTTTFSPNEVSDGTIKWLCILVSVFVIQSKLYLIEEPENFLHPWMQQRLIAIMREQSEQNNSIFILTTHSSTILNSVLTNEVLLVSYKKTGTKVNKITDENMIEAFLEESDFKLGDLWISGAISGVPGDE